MSQPAATRPRTRYRWLGPVVAVLTFAALGYWLCFRPQTPDLDRADRITLYSIDYRGLEEDLPAPNGKLYGYPILGKVEITELEQKKELIAALRKGINTRDIQQAKCFWPRHVLRIEQGGQIADYVICFSCQNYMLYRDGETRHHLTPGIGRQVRPVFDKPLNDAKIPIAP